jgi:GNAT superfamily N-acetyltransferase
MATAPRPVVRLATVDDVEELVRLRARMFELLGEPADDGDRRGWRAACATVLAEGIASATIAAAVAEAPARPRHLVASGAVSVWQRLPGPQTPHGRYGYIASMVTEPRWQRRGLARRILETLLAWCDDNGIAKVDLHASPDGVQLYRSLGFTDRPGAFPELVRRPGLQRPGDEVVVPRP